MGYETAIYFDQGGDRLVLGSGGELQLEAGCTMDVQGGTFQFADSAALVLGTGSDVTLQWDGSNLLLSAAADDSLIEIGDSAATQKSFDVKVYGDAANGADYVLWDASDSALEFAGAARLDFSSVDVAAANTDGGIIKAGTSGAPVTEDTADMKFMSFYFDNGATSGDNRGIYNRLYLTGAGGGGESLRTFTTCSDVACGTAHGVHASLNFGSTGSVTGLGVASRSTLHVPDDASWAPGTVAAVQAEIYSDGADSDTDGATEVSFIRVVNGGDSNGVSDVDTDAFLLTLDGGSVGAGNVMAAQSAWAVSHTLRIKGPDGNTYYLGVSDTQ